MRNRTCNDIQWNPQSPHLMAAGFDKPSQAVDFNTIVWDVTRASPARSKDSPNGRLSENGVICKLGNDEPTCICWQAENPDHLLIGTSTGSIQLFDIRAPDTSTSQMSLIAHTASRPRKLRVKGLRVDPSNPSVLASFTDAALEPVKIWDFRKGSNSKPRSTILAHNTRSHTGLPNLDSSIVNDICWSTVRQNVIAVATSLLPEISFYSAFKPGTTDATSVDPLYCLSLDEPCRQMRLFPNDGTSLFNLMVSTSAGYSAINVRLSVGLDVGANESVAVAVDEVLSLHNLEQSSPASATLSSTQHAAQVGRSGLVSDQNIDQVMKVRCGCGYGIVAAKNIQILTEELDQIRLQPVKSNTTEAEAANKAWTIKNIQQLIRVWNWMDRVENIDSDRLDLSIKTCGIRSILSSAEARSSATSKQERNIVTGAMVYASLSRCRARLMCGWAANIWMGTNTPTKLYINVDEADSSNEEDEELDEDDVEEEIKEVVELCEYNDSFERACALSIFQGNITSAVTLLQNTVELLQSLFEAPDAVKANDNRPIEENAKSSKSTESAAARALEDEEEENGGGNLLQSDYPNVTAEYVHLLSLVAMCIAGYSCPPIVSTPSTSTATAAGKGGKAQPAPQPTPQQPPFNAAVASANSKMWLNMCSTILKQLESDIALQRLESCYLLAGLRFLLISLEDITRPPGKSHQQPTQLVFGKYTSILTDTRVAMEDRVAIAVSYLSDFELSVFLKAAGEESTTHGVLEGLVLTGFANDGFEIVQKYLDNTADLQTVALLVAKQADRNAAVAEAGAESGSSSGTFSLNAKAVDSTATSSLPWLQASVLTSPSLPHPVSKSFMWLSEYRLLLNKWQHYFERAALDVELGKEHRARLVRQQHEQQRQSRAGGGRGHVNTGRPPGMAAGRGAAAGSKSATATQAAMSADRNKSSRNPFYTLPPHFDVANHILLRCNFCSASLPSDQNMPQTQQAFLKKQCPIINCCYNCKKQLPRCYVCSLYMGFVNPLFELNRLLSQRRKAAEGALFTSTENNGNASNPSATGTNGNAAIPVSTPSTARDSVNEAVEKSDSECNVLGFGKWFFFCQLCRHGGHATCVEDWFQNEEAIQRAVSDSGSNDGDIGRTSDKSRPPTMLRRDICGVPGCLCRCMAVS
jgi:hypothetical protein